MHLLKASLFVAPLLSGVEAALKTFHLTISEGTAAPDGYSRIFTLVNGTTPGPLIEVNQGDDVEVIVTNTAAENATIHFHGIEQYRTPWSDGVPGVSQRSIMKDETFTYRWAANQYGSYWYHSHYRSQIEDGLYGPIVIHPKDSIPKPFSVISPSEVDALIAAEAKRQPLLFADVNHLPSHKKFEIIDSINVEISCYDSIVLNGKGNVNCLDHALVQASLTDLQKIFLSAVPGSEMTDKACVPARNIDQIFGAKGRPRDMPAGIFEGCVATNGSREFISAQPNEWIALDVIGANNFVLGVFSIDEHDMWVYAVDGEYVNPQRVQAFRLNNGDRVSIMVKAKDTTGGFKIRAQAATPPQMLTGYAVLSINGSQPPDPDSKSYITLPGGPVTPEVTFLDYAKATQFNVDGIPRKADAFFRFEMQADSSALWALNRTRLDPASIDTANLPVLFNPVRTEPQVDNPVFMTTNNDTWVDMLFFAPGSGPMPPHPIHKHGNKMYNLGSGTGKFIWNSINDAIDARPELFNLVNPPKVDAIMTLEDVHQIGVWTAVRYHVTDPGAWAIHCHIDNHVEGGMLAVIQDGLDKWPTIPQEYWDALK